MKNMICFMTLMFCGMQLHSSSSSTGSAGMGAVAAIGSLSLLSTYGMLVKQADNQAPWLVSDYIGGAFLAGGFSKGLLVVNSGERANGLGLIALSTTFAVSALLFRSNTRFKRELAELTLRIEPKTTSFDQVLD